MACRALAASAPVPCCNWAATTGADKIYASVNNMNGTFDLNGRNTGIVGLSGSGTVTNSVSSTTSTLTFGSCPDGATDSGGQQWVLAAY